MDSPPILDAAFSGFRLVRERPKALAYWFVGHLAFVAVSSLFTVTTMGPALTKIVALSGTAKADPAQVFALYGQILPAYGVVMLLWFALYGFMFGAANRAILKPQDDRFGYLRFGADELRQMGLTLVLALVSTGIYLGVGLVAILGAGVIGTVAGVVGGATNLVGGQILGGVIAVVILICGMAFFWVRLSLASPLTYATGRINVFGSWSLTRARFWSLAGTYLLTFALLMVVYLVGMLFIGAVAMAIGINFNGLTQMLMKPDASTLTAFYTPTRIVILVLQAALATLTTPVILCPAIDIYRRIASRPSGATADVFS